MRPTKDEVMAFMKPSPPTEEELAGLHGMVSQSGVLHPRLREETVNWLNENKLHEQGLHIEWVYDQRFYIRSAIDLIKQNILFGGLLAACVLLLFLRSVRSTIVVGLAIPISIIGTFILLDLMTTSLLLMVVAGDLLTLLIAWHLVGVLLYFLLGHNTRDKSAWRYAFWTKITYRLGDLPLVIAAALLYQAYGTWSLPLLFEQITAQPDAHQVLGLRLPDVVAALIAFSAYARSAQFLVHTWLPYTMSGPTPVSALMHAGIVNAGGFIINRFAPVFVQSSDVLHWVFIVGLFTAVIGSVLMLTQNDIKKSLGYSTMGQMGFMIMECGVGAFSLAIYHLIAHGLFKGTLFLGAGGAIGEARRNDGEGVTIA